MYLREAAIRTAFVLALFHRLMPGRNRFRTRGAREL